MPSAHVENDLWQCHCMTLRRTARRISQAYDLALAPAGLRATQFSMLAMLDGGGPRNVFQMADAMELDRTTMGKNLRPLERLGLVRLAADPADRRARTVSLSAAGLKRLRAAYPLWQSVHERYERDNGRGRSRALRDQLHALRLPSASPLA